MRYVSHQLSLHFATSLLVEFKTFASTQCAICESDFFEIFFCDVSNQVESLMIVNMPEIYRRLLLLESSCNFWFLSKSFFKSKYTRVRLLCSPFLAD